MRNAEKPLTYRVPEAARLLGMSERAVWTMIYRGELPVVRWGRRVLVPRVELEARLRAAGLLPASEVPGGR